MRLLDWRDFDRRDRIVAWDALAERASEPNPFYESWYLLPSLRALAKDTRDLHILALEVDGRLEGVLPIQRSRNYYGYPIPHWRNWVHANCFLGLPLVARGHERAFWHGLLHHCDQAGGLGLFLHLAGLPAQGPMHQALADVLAEQARPAATVQRSERAMLASGVTTQQYWQAALPQKKRKELRRQHRRLAEHGNLTVERLCDYTDVAKWTREFLALESRGWKGKAGSALDNDPATSELFTFAVAGAAARGRLERLALRLDGKPIAMLASFLTAPGAYSYKTAFDEDWARYSPGVLLQQENLAMLTREEIEWVDSCAAANHPMIDHVWRERRTIASHSIAIGGALRRALFAQLARRETGQTPRGIQ
ncbi:MAG: GNAT family N-acetyltransferase [Erythrobacter sp.]|nr:GNAT family N-acetyltransferase [Erythrobacter sp.]